MTDCTMKFTGVVGRPPDLNKDMIKTIIDAVYDVITTEMVAARSRIHFQRLYEWLKKGRDDLLVGKCSIYAQLAEEYDYARSEVVKRHFDDMDDNPKKFMCISWKLGKCMPGVFGPESEEIKELKSIVNKLLDKSNNFINRSEYETVNEEKKQA